MANDSSKKHVNQQWLKLLSNTLEIEAFPDSSSLPYSLGYQIFFENITSLRAMSFSSLDVHDCEYQLRLTLFDVVHKRFIGRTFCSKFYNPDSDQRQEVALKLPVYFHTTVADKNLIMVAEIVAKTFPKNPMPEDTTTEKLASLGWGYHRLFPPTDKLADVSYDISSSTKKIDLIRGTPKALFYLEEPLEANVALRKSPGSMVTFTLLKHAALSPVSHLMQENVFYAGYDRVPGLKHEAVRIPGTDEYDLYLQPHLLESATGYVDNLTIRFATSIQKFESELCRLVLNQQADEDDDDGATMFKEKNSAYVTERRIEVGVHNGHCFIQTPQHAYLEPENCDVALTKNSSFGKGRKKFAISGTCLVLRSRLQFSKFPIDPKVALVFKLHYLLTIPRYTEHAKFGNCQTLAVMIAWTSWNPFHTAMHYEDPVSLHVYGGAQISPSRQLFYNLGLKEKCRIDALSFNFLTEAQIKQQKRSPSRSVLYDQTIPSRQASFKPEEISQHQYRDQRSPQRERRVPIMSASGSSFDGGSPIFENMMEESSPSPLPPARNMNRSPSYRRTPIPYISGSNFPEIVDSKGHPAVDVDYNTTLASNILPNILTNEVLQASEIVFQFQAFCDPAYDDREHPSSSIQSLFFTFQFYRFEPVSTQRVSLGAVELNEHGSVKPRLLRKIETSDYDADHSGLEVRFFFDPTSIRPGETKSFLNYLATNSLVIDVWNGENLMLVGTASLPLRGLLRHGRPAISVSCGLDVSHTDYDGENVISAEIVEDSSVCFLGLPTLQRGKLCMRAGHIGHKGERIMSIGGNQRPPLIDADISRKSFYGGTISSIVTRDTSKITRKVKPEKVKDAFKQIVDYHASSVGDKASQHLNEVELRKLERMKAVREAESLNGPPTPGQRAILKNQQKTPQIRDLLTVMDYRNDLRDDQISEMLLMSITTTHSIYPVLGVAELIEFRISNPFDTDETITVTCTDTDLRLITDGKEWQYFKEHYGLTTPIEENIFTFDALTGHPQFLLHPKESVILPFRYQGFASSEMSKSRQVSDYFNPSSKGPTRTVENLAREMLRKNIQVVLRSKTDSRPISILNLKVESQPPVINQTFRFFHPENTFMKKCIRLQPFGKLGEEKFHVECDDIEVVCHSRATRPDDPREIYIKAPCGESPHVRMFFLTIYSDKYTAYPSQVWRFFLHGMQRVDVSCVYGQISKLPVLIRGSSTDRLLQCFSSQPYEMKIYPKEPFVISTKNKAEVEVSVKSRFIQGKKTRHLYINVVDNEFHQLYRSCLVVVKTEEPIITKEFNLSISKDLTSTCNKMISYTNPYACHKLFHLSTSRSDLLKFREDILKLSSRQKTNIGLRFQPGFAVLKKVPVYVFINDEHGQNEESFLINLAFV